MDTIAANGSAPVRPNEPGGARPKLNGKPSAATIVLFVGLLAIGLAYAAWSLNNDVIAAGVGTTPMSRSSCWAWRC